MPFVPSSFLFTTPVSQGTSQSIVHCMLSRSYPLSFDWISLGSLELRSHFSLKSRFNQDQFVATGRD